VRGNGHRHLQHVKLAGRGGDVTAKVVGSQHLPTTITMMMMMTMTTMMLMMMMTMMLMARHHMDTNSLASDPDVSHDRVILRGHRAKGPQRVTVTPASPQLPVTQLVPYAPLPPTPHPSPLQSTTQ
jgi:hypothetical protein